jgi:aspartyl-tRNA(Asn)/glutamyl-tRNA(Gln) amidotransferase subunit C
LRELPLEETLLELSHEEVRRIAELARLDLTDAEVALYAQQLSSILQHFQRLQAIDTSHIEPTNAPDKVDHQFRVSAVLDND